MEVFNSPIRGADFGPLVAEGQPTPAPSPCAIPFADNQQRQGDRCGEQP
jgi:hypothetical protein